MTLLAGLWHALKVVSAGLYWLILVALVWAGFALMGTNPSWGWANFAFVLALFAARGLISPRFVSTGVSYVIGCGAILVYFWIAAVLTGYTGA